MDVEIRMSMFEQAIDDLGENLCRQAQEICKLQKQIGKEV